MTGAVAFAFALGLLAPLAPAGLPWALAAFGLSIAAENRPGAGLSASLKGGVLRGTLAGLVFAFALLLAAGLEELGLDISDGLAIPNLLLSAGLVLVGLGLAIRSSRIMRGDSASATACFALAFAVISMPGLLGILHRLLERSAEQGAGGVIGAAILVLAGSATTFAAISAAGNSVGYALSRSGAFRRAIGAIPVIGGGAISVAYWLPDARGGVDDPGGGLGDALAGASQSIGEFLAGNLLVPALFFFALAAWALIRATRAGHV